VRPWATGFKVVTRTVRDDRLLSMPAAGLSDLEQFIIILADFKESGQKHQEQPFLTLGLVRSKTVCRLHGTGTLCRKW
jgi:hypothetical protein